ncbi:AP-2 complex subunit sigma isoform X1 [Cucurbita moschata]|uniref:AP-2 complex subunit sigma n=1 Tax=Cucurbita moschata TaxID=3662 RepID=A0A6J1FA77_CUCMO|nr:AP-2 complex subunit sigma isoform X1 [Cucurbita moschata]
MIRFILLQNRQGKTRLAKYYVPLEESEKHKVEYEVHRLVVNRDPKFTNFVEFRTHKVIYRRYAGLFFSLCVDITDNELAYLECIHLFVEILDHFFSNVCELDLVFNFHKVYLILDEFILAGKLQETSKKAPQNQLEPSAADIRLYEDHVYQVKVQSLIDMEMSLRTSKTKLLAGIDLIRRLKVSALEIENENKLKSKRSSAKW